MAPGRRLCLLNYVVVSVAVKSSSVEKIVPAQAWGWVAVNCEPRETKLATIIALLCSALVVVGGDVPLGTQ